MSKSEISQLEKFTTSLSTKFEEKVSAKDVTGFVSYFKSYSKELERLQYFEFIPKESTQASKAKLKLAVDLKCLFNYYQFQSYVVGINCLYLFLILKRSKNVIGFGSLMSIALASGFTFYYFRLNFNKILNTMDFFFKDDVIFLSNKLKRKDLGFSENVSCINLRMYKLLYIKLFSINKFLIFYLKIYHLLVTKRLPKFSTNFRQI